MAKAVFHKNQRVFVKTVGTWAVIEHVLPQWAKGVEEPIRIHYDVGLGREFAAHELLAESRENEALAIEQGDWRVVRNRNRWQNESETGHHPAPGTFPVVVTEGEGGGWRVPGAEYDRDPRKIEAQARLIAKAPQLARLARALLAYVSEETIELSQELVDLAKEAKRLLADIQEAPSPLRSADPAPKDR